MIENIYKYIIRGPNAKIMYELADKLIPFQLCIKKTCKRKDI